MYIHICASRRSWRGHKQSHRIRRGNTATKKRCTCMLELGPGSA
uniref:Uncharacterized protein n=1 Tax=Macrostomum lignano TaxID=282301 RepID=A0A1I8HWB8_9PLAT